MKPRYFINNYNNDNIIIDIYYTLLYGKIINIYITFLKILLTTIHVNNVFCMLICSSCLLQLIFFFFLSYGL